MISKNFMFKLLVCGIILVAAILWLLSVTVEAFSFFNLSWACVILAGGVGLAFILRGVFQKDLGTIKKFYIWFGAGLLIVALFALISAIAVPENIVLPIIAIILAAALMLGMVATGGKKWDEGDNQAAGYKNYHERKKEEEKNENKEK